MNGKVGRVHAQTVRDLTRVRAVVFAVERFDHELRRFDERRRHARNNLVYFVLRVALNLLDKLNKGRIVNFKKYMFFLLIFVVVVKMRG